MSDGWKTVKIGDLGEVITGKTPSTKISNYWGGTIPFITPPDLNGGAVTVTQRFITEQGLAVVNALPYGAVLTSCIGSIGRVGIVARSPAASNQQINSLIVNEQKANNWYCLYAILYLNSELNMVAQKTTIPILNKSNFSKILLPLPPLPEQRRIAAILTAVQRAIELQERLISLTTELKKALMQKLFTEGTRGERQKMTEIGQVPESWELVELGSERPRILEIIRNGYTGEQTTDVQEYKVSRIETISAGFIDTNRVRYAVKPSKENIKKYRIQRGDILFSHINSDPHIGKTGIAEDDIPNMLHGMNLLLIRVNQALINPMFLNYIFQWYREKGVFISICSRAVNQSSINQGKLKALLIPFPERDVQDSIAALIRKVDEKFVIHNNIQAALRELFRTLLHQLMTAQIKVNEVDLSELKAIGIEVD